MQTTSSLETHLDEFVAKFEKDYSLVSFLSTGTTMRSAWLLENGASRHMIEAWELFINLTERNLGLHVKLGDDSRCAMNGE
jgi:hypothetical protein